MFPDDEFVYFDDEMVRLRDDDRPISEVDDSELLELMRRFAASRERKCFHRKSLLIWLAVLRAIDEQRPPMTVRGLFYALEISGLVPKTEAGYRQVERQVVEMRRLGLLPYDFITDGTRSVRRAPTYTCLRECLDGVAKYYRRAIWEDQPEYVEIWLEKDAIAGVLFEVTYKWDVPLCVCRGYPSETFLYDAAERLIEQDKPVFIYYIGDLDPTGWNISEVIQRRLREFGADFFFERIAVTPEQVELWQLPTRPAKPKDTRAKNWKLPCVEVDAIPANKLRELCEEAILRHLDWEAYSATKEAEKAERKRLAEITKQFEWQ
jgi:hypothetical protein